MNDLELTEWLAVNVMGWHVEGDHRKNTIPSYYTADNSIFGMYVSDWRPLEKIEQAFMVVEVMREMKYVFKLRATTNDFTQDYQALFAKAYSGQWLGKWGKSPSEAICEAVYEAVKDE